MLAIWVPELPFQLACQQDGGLRDRPLAFLSPGRTPSLWLVNRLAKVEGVAPGDPLDHALRHLPGLQVLDPTPQVWWEAQANLGDFLSRWSPQGLLGRMGEALLELHGTNRLFGSPQDAAWRIQKELGANIGWTSHGGLSRSATAARLASRLEHHLEQVGDGFEQSFLAPHSLSHLPDLSPRLRWRFHRLGLRQLGDLQPLPLPTLFQLMPEAEARKVLTQARGEDRPRLPMLADPPGESRHPWRLEPPRLPEQVFLAPWCLERLWSEGRSPRTLYLRWWDVDGIMHRWTADPEDLTKPPLELAPIIEGAFRHLSLRRILVHRLELHLAWGLGRTRSLFEAPRSARLSAMEPALARLRKRYPEVPVLPGWARAAETVEPYRAGSAA
jgi:hypothetical protein